MAFWADNYWADGFWAAGFWEGSEASGPPLVVTAGFSNGSLVGDIAHVVTRGYETTVDTTAPILSLATGVSTGATTGTGTVTSDESGTLYYLATVNASELAATIKAGSSQAGASGLNNVTFTGLTPGTAYYAHYVQDDDASNESNVVSSTAFTTDALVVVEETNAGGWFWGQVETQRLKREKDKQKRAKAKKKARKLKNKLDRALYLEQRKIEDQEEREAELARLAALVESNRNVIMDLNNDRLTFVMDAALEKQTFSAIERLERELQQERDAQMFHMMATQVLLNQ